MQAASLDQNPLAAQAAGLTGPEIAGPAPRHRTVGVRVGQGEGAVTVGGGAPVVVQSMTNTDTADIDATVAQVAQLARAGSELVRITVD
ncbi:MAG: 4-hydroxy-3-methylbut-2-en-1-yl diphosphate synthase, partial [Methylobacterium sp.]